MNRITLLCTCFLAPCLAFGQVETDEIHHHNLAFGVGPAIPLGNSTNYLSTAPFIRLGYGYRFNRLFQADLGLQLAFGAANNQNAVITDVGTVQSGDHEFMVPLGGRIYIPQPFHRMQMSVGGGGVYLHYSETVPSNGYYAPSCYSCTTRGGWGGYGMANVSYFLDSNHNFRVGTTFQYIAGSTNGQAVANIPAVKTTDHWMNIAFDFGFSF
ncbi:MAG TPA: hypothetical protein VMJ75_09335 [Candidatus Acidoferrales bacterium]|nr:hypothetical protein [Candidatus Acidoferrales bacterium]HXK01034.1 hypothetical protein [Verrucomicrobiae bacterium]